MATAPPELTVVDDDNEKLKKNGDSAKNAAIQILLFDDFSAGLELIDTPVTMPHDCDP